MAATIQVELPEALLLHGQADLPRLEQRSRFLLALKFFELGELSSGQAAQMAGLSRVQFLLEASRLGVPAARLSREEMEQEFADA